MIEMSSVDDEIIHVQIGHRHHYYTRHRNRLIACDGAGRWEPKAAQARLMPPPDIRRQIMELSESRMTITEGK